MGVVTGGGGGGAAPAVGFAVRLSATVTVANAAVVPVDTAIFDPSGFVDLSTHIATIPAGKGGVYAISVSCPAMSMTEVITTPTAIWAQFDTGGNWPNVVIGAPAFAFTNPQAFGGGGHVAEYDAGDTVKVTLHNNNSADMHILGGGNGFVWACWRLGSVPS
jgi:hypothetical protein